MAFGQHQLDRRRNSVKKLAHKVFELALILSLYVLSKL
jgi:hypothetical protein